MLIKNIQMLQMKMKLDIYLRIKKLYITKNKR